MQIREEVAFTKGRIIVRGKLVTRGKAKRADYILYYKPNIPIAIIEAKDNNHSVGDGTCKLLTDDLFSLPIPIPPLAEQHRIVTKVDELMVLSGRLEEQLTTAQTERGRFVEAVLNQVLTDDDPPLGGARSSAEEMPANYGVSH